MLQTHRGFLPHKSPGTRRWPRRWRPMAGRRLSELARRLARRARARANPRKCQPRKCQLSISGGMLACSNASAFNISRAGICKNASTFNISRAGICTCQHPPGNATLAFPWLAFPGVGIFERRRASSDNTKIKKIKRFRKIFLQHPFCNIFEKIANLTNFLKKFEKYPDKTFLQHV